MSPNLNHSLVKWKNFSIEDATWEHEENCFNCPDLAEEFWGSGEPSLEEGNVTNPTDKVGF
ncbi:M-phase phosphoprotein 8 [Entomophthora muscae]|uniref:M-phase phosphoprotein 8 n=1 Tax=Entomophthora muscae TaxID=34485 RepID=A0ACC2TVX1_9FUNG|nr:M-phase phosphoprotein 8 [Entomophthora muscae]